MTVKRITIMTSVIVLLPQEVQDLLEAWSQHVEHCDRIFLRTPTYNKSMFFGGKKPPFKKGRKSVSVVC